MDEITNNDYLVMTTSNYEEYDNLRRTLPDFQVAIQKPLY